MGREMLFACYSFEGLLCCAESICEGKGRGRRGGGGCLPPPTPPGVFVTVGDGVPISMDDSEMVVSWMHRLLRHKASRI